MVEIDITANELVSALLDLTLTEPVYLLDSCGVGQVGSNRLIAGIEPLQVVEFSSDDAEKTLENVSQKFSGDLALIFTLSYDFGTKMAGLKQRMPAAESEFEPDFFGASFDTLTIHDYDTGKTSITGNPDNFGRIQKKLRDRITTNKVVAEAFCSNVTSNFTKDGYLAAIEIVKDQIRRGNTYQTNLTQKLTANLKEGSTPAAIFDRLRSDNPAPFAAYIHRLDSTVVSSSPEMFISIDQGPNRITASPIKGTIERASTPTENNILKRELLESEKDRAENIMIVDLLRNDLGRICKYGTVRVESLCELAEHPTLFHLVSTVTGTLNPDASVTDILKAVFPCGSITGAPKISTMKIIDQVETARRGLSMGTIGYFNPGSGFGRQNSAFELSVAIRTMVIREHVATFNVGGGIVIDSDPECEYYESLTKAKALLSAIGADPEFESA